MWELGNGLIVMPRRQFDDLKEMYKEKSLRLTYLENHRRRGRSNRTHSGDTGQPGPPKTSERKVAAKVFMKGGTFYEGLLVAALSKISLQSEHQPGAEWSVKGLDQHQARALKQLVIREWGEQHGTKPPKSS